MALALALSVVGALATSCSAPGEEEPQPEPVPASTAPGDAEGSATEDADGENGEAAGGTEVVYETDFESQPGSEWTVMTTDVDPAQDEKFLGQFGRDRVGLTVADLGQHDAITVAFDLYVLGQWEGAASSDWWSLEADGYGVVATTFSNTDEEQSYPDLVQFGLNPARTGAAETESLGYAESGGPIVADSVYRIERTFLHPDDELQLEFRGHLGEGNDSRSWGLDNIVVSTHDWPTSTDATTLEITIADGRISLAGTLPSEADVALAELIVEDAVGERTDTVELGSEDAVTPLWVHELVFLVIGMAPYNNVRLEVGGAEASLSGTVSSEAWGDDLARRLQDALGPHVDLSSDLEYLIEQDVVDEVGSVRLTFASGSSELSAEDRLNLDGMVTLMERNQDLVVSIAGHTDGVGEDGANHDLSGDRAEAAFEYLVASGVPAESLELQARGFAQPEVEEFDDEDRAANRRVIFGVARG